MSEGLLLPGWFCRLCRAFNGEAKEKRTECRVCDAPKDAETKTDERAKDSKE